MMYPKTFEKLIECFQLLPGVGAKTAERYAFTMLEAPQEQVKLFAKTLLECKENIRHCQTCGNISDTEECPICRDAQRNHQMICVVQSPKDILAMEKTQEYKGVYHVLNGLISTSKGIMPEDINIESLIQRITPETEEVIIAPNATVEGETTALYLDKLLSGKGVLVTRIAHGLPMGGHLDYADELTLIKAFEGRKKIQ